MAEAAPPTRRRWLRFGLRGLFAAVTLLAVFMGWLVWELNFIRERRAWHFKTQRIWSEVSLSSA